MISNPTLEHAPPLLNKQKKINRNWLYGYLFILPTFGAYLLFSLIPTLAVFVLSLFRWDFVNNPSFVGVQNFNRLFHDPLFIKSLGITFSYVLYNVPLQYLLSLIIVLALSRPLRGVKAFRVIYLVPWVTTPVAISIVWKWVLSPTTGVMNYLLGKMGMDRVDWFSSAMAMKSVLMVNIWQHTGFSTLIMLVGIQSIPKMFYESAKIDGASVTRVFWHITLPLLKPTLLFLFITGIIGSFQIFDAVYTITNGGPGDSTSVLYFLIYKQAFNFLDMGYASAMSVILFLILMIITLLQFTVFRNTTYDLS
ncbi:carbohydrate ABC transporter permease [Paenibacillus roseipurpureus]|uniref:Sugar ABC transporter permease n=1 Tax=Paenibacillus roseopurpureus TaxID=2918901 RepID=A0AA96LTY9_9BACL|nr:sugar ABC transporter permease [Paenibacillus sp. MBLB1832]WNR46029.1 sugar ABC transporter permease [Paenibacillus sp. MBLB1832]